MYVGIASSHNTAAPFLNKIPLSAATATAPLVCGAGIDLNIKDVTNLGNTGAVNNPARGGTPGNVGVDRMLYVPATPTPVNQFYIANNGGVASSTGEPTSNLSFTVFKNQASFAAATGTGDEFTLIVDDLGKVSPGRKGIPQMLVYKNVMFLARNVATNQNPGTVSNGGELWKCAANCTTAASWTRIVSSTPGIGAGGTGMEKVTNQAISMLQVSGGYLYVGFDNMTDGARMYRTAVDPSLLNDHTVFTEVGRIASGVKTHTDGTTLACAHAQSLGGVCMGYQILSSSIITKNQYSYLYFTVGCTLLTASGNGQTCDVNLTAAVTLPAMSVLIQRD